VTQYEKPVGSPWIVPVFLPHLGCPHRCVFCNQHVVSGTLAPPSPEALRDRLESQLRPQQGTRGRRRQVAFYGGSFTGADPGLQRAYLLSVRPFLVRGWVDSLRVSCRPDELQPDRLAFLREHGVRTVEVGVQSLSDPVLARSRRGYGARDALEAIRRVKGFGLEVGAQMMVGLPGDGGREGRETAEGLCDVRPDFVRIYPVLVLRGTELARRYREGSYRPLDMPAALERCARLLARFRQAGIPVIRIGLQEDEGMQAGGGGAVVAGPRHPAFGFLVQAFLYREEMLRALADRRPEPEACAGVRFRIHPQDRPLFSGYRRAHLPVLQRALGEQRYTVAEDSRMGRGRVEVTEAS